MWENSTDLQYALRVYNLTDGEDYAAVGYTITADGTSFSEQLKADTYAQ